MLGTIVNTTTIIAGAVMGSYLKRGIIVFRRMVVASNAVMGSYLKRGIIVFFVVKKLFGL